MAQVEDRKGGRETNVELNLVAFIDLMSVCIIFLLISAVWTQVSMIELGTSVYAKKGESQPKPPLKTEDIQIRLYVLKDGHLLQAGDQKIGIPKNGETGEYDYPKLLEQATLIKSRLPEDKKDAIVSLDDDRTYDNMIRAMDVMMAGGFANIAVSAKEN